MRQSFAQVNLPTVGFASLLVALALLNGCERITSDEKNAPEKSQEALQEKSQSLSAKQAVQADAKPALVGTVIAKHARADFQYPDCKSEQCPEINIKRLSTNYAWIDQALDQQIVAFSTIGEDEADADSTNKKTKVTAAKTLQQNVNTFVKNYDADVRAGARAIPYSMNIEASLLGQKGNVALFEIDAYFFSGGAHGSSPRQYYNFDLLHKKQLKLDDVLLAGQQQKLHDLLYKQFVAWLKKDNPDVNIEEYQAMWKFFVSDNFSFGKDGLEFLYQQYDIGPYVVGLPEFTLPYAQLKGIVKPEYL